MPLDHRRQRPEQDPPGRDDRSDRRIGIGGAAEERVGHRSRGPTSTAISPRSKRAASRPTCSRTSASGTVRELVIGEDDRKATPAEISNDADAWSSTMMESGRLRRLHRPDLPAQRLRQRRRTGEVSKAAARAALYASHLRYDGAKLREGIEEAIAIGERAKIPVHVFHIKVTGQKNFGRMKEVIELVEAARARGVQGHRRSVSLRRQQHQPHRDHSAMGAGRRHRQAGRAAEESEERARIRKEMENTNPVVGEPLSVGRHLAERAAGGDWPHPRLGDRPVIAQPQVRRHARCRGREAGRQGSVRLRVRPADRRARLDRLRLLHHRRSATSRWR